MTHRAASREKCPAFAFATRVALAATASRHVEGLRMGATFWESVTAYHESVEKALRLAQIDCFRKSGYDLRILLTERIEDMIEAIQSCEEDDPYDLLGLYRDALDEYRQMEACGIPEEPTAQIEILRRIEAISGDGVGNILDITGIGQEPEEGRVQQLTPERIEDVFRTARPTLAEARSGMDRLADSISRGTAIVLPVYEDGTPVGWYFAGYSAD